MTQAGMGPRAQRKVLLTGASGFIGRFAIAPLLARGFEVHALYRHAEGTGEAEVPGLYRHRADLLDGSGEGRLRALIADIKASHLLHLAWYAEPGKFWNSAENLKWVKASLSLAQAFAEAGGREMVMAGSCAEYDWSLPGGHCREAATPLNPHTLYGTAKHALHQILTAYAREAELRLAWGRIFLLYGPGEHPARLVPSVVLPLLEGREALCSHGAQVRDFMHVADVAGAFVSLLDSPVQGPVNIASGVTATIRDLVGIIAKSLDGEALVRLGALPDHSPPRLVPAVERLRDEVGFRPAFTLEEGLSDAILWWRGRRGFDGL